jgi:F1F0 ATPase subunit 2
MAYIPTGWAIPLCFGAGLAIGLFYFGGLWLTVSRLSTSRHPALLFAGSFIIRTLAAVGAIGLLSGGQWLLVAVCMLGFIIMRTVLTKRWGPVAIDTSAP